MSTEDEVRKASEQFYAALNRMGNGDPSSMADAWSHSATVTTMHPIGGREVGWDEVKGPWYAIRIVFLRPAQNDPRPSPDHSGNSKHSLGDMNPRLLHMHHRFSSP
jgi:hypothetical protein